VAIIRHVENDAGRSAMDNITRADPDRVWTVREVAEHVGIGGIGPVIVGTPEKVADEIEAWFEATDVDGLNVPFAVSPGDFEVPAQPVDATQALNLSAGVSNCKVSRGRSFS